MSIANTDDKITTALARPDIIDRIDSALSGWMSGKDFCAQLAIHFSSKPEIADCTVKTQFEAAHTCAALQLLPTLGQVAIIPRKVKNKKGEVIRIEATVMPQWQGYKSLMERNPEVLDVTAHLVHVTDGYEFDAVHHRIINHTFDPFDEKRTFNTLKDVRGGYLVITFRDGRPEKHHFVTAERIGKARDCAQTKDVWNKWFYPQALKTIYRDGFARRVVPVDPLVARTLQTVVEADDSALGNDPMRVKRVHRSPLNDPPPALPPADEQPGESIDPEPPADEPADEFERVNRAEFAKCTTPDAVTKTAKRLMEHAEGPDADVITKLAGERTKALKAPPKEGELFGKGSERAD